MTEKTPTVRRRPRPMMGRKVKIDDTPPKTGVYVAYFYETANATGMAHTVLWGLDNLSTIEAVQAAVTVIQKGVDKASDPEAPNQFEDITVINWWSISSAGLEPVPDKE